MSGELEAQDLVSIEAQPGAEGLARARERAGQPGRVGAGGAREAHALDGHRHGLEGEQPPVRFQRREVHEPQVVPEFRVGLDPLVVVEQVAAAVEDQPPPVDLDRLGVVRGMPPDDVRPARVDEAAGEGGLLGGELVAPVRAPMERDDEHVAGPLEAAQPAAELLEGRRAQVREVSEAGPVLAGGPVFGHAAAFRPERADEDAAPPWEAEDRGRARLAEIPARAGERDAGASERLQRVGQAGEAEVEGVVVGQRAVVEAGRREAGEVLGAHPVADRPARPVVAPGDRGLEVRQPQVGGEALEDVERLAPRIGEARRARHGAAPALGQGDVLGGVLDEELAQARIARVGEDLVHAPAGHHVAAEKKPDHA